jgi:hypothetical protein
MKSSAKACLSRSECESWKQSPHSFKKSAASLIRSIGYTCPDTPKHQRCTPRVNKGAHGCVWDVPSICKSTHVCVRKEAAP